MSDFRAPFGRDEIVVSTSLEDVGSFAAAIPHSGVPHEFQGLKGPSARQIDPGGVHSCIESRVVDRCVVDWFGNREVNLIVVIEEQLQWLW
jgi:hypothetical protein